MIDFNKNAVYSVKTRDNKTGIVIADRLVYGKEAAIKELNKDCPDYVCRTVRKIRKDRGIIRKEK
jgi:hypothetical protein